MNDLRAAAEISIEAISQLIACHGEPSDCAAIELAQDAADALRAALAEPAVPALAEPVAYLYHDAASAEVLNENPLFHSVLLVLAADRRPWARNETPLYTAQPAAQPKAEPLTPTEAQIVAAARVLNRRHAVCCGVDVDDSWYINGEDFKDDARAALTAAHGIGKGAA